MKKIILVLLLLTFKLGIAQTGWFWQNPTPQGADLNDVVYLNSTTIIAVGQGSTFLKSTDSGLTWTEKSLFPYDISALNKFSFVSIYASDENNIKLLLRSQNYNNTIFIYDMVRSTDGGTTWNTDFIGYTPEDKFTKITFTNNNTGYVFSQFNSNPEIYRTTNAGINWNKFKINGDSTLQSVFFLNQNTGWIGSWNNRKFYRTSNAGIQWDSCIIQDNFYVPYFINENTGWIAPFGRSYKTTNGGINFTQQGGVDIFPSSIFFTNINTGWVVGSRGVSVTTNSGVSWQLTYYSPQYNFGNSIGNAGSSGTNIIAVGINGKMVKSQNSGFNWDSISSSKLGTNLSGISFVNENTGWLVRDAHLYNSTNGGSSWNPKDTVNLIYEVKFLNQNTGVTVGGKILTTTNGGNSWSSYQDGFFTFGDINFGNQNIWYAYGYDGTVTSSEKLVKTTNSGQNWFDVNSPSNATTMDLFFVNENMGYKLAFNEISKTINGGLSWSLISAQWGTKLWFVNENTGWITAGSAILKTTNGGVNWIPVFDRGDNYSFTNIKFINNLTGYATGGIYPGGVIIKTTDGGLNWDINSNYYTPKINELDFINAITGWAIGEKGTLIKTTTGGTIGVQQISTTTPDKFHLSQNYPNPFNPVTNIEFSLPQKSFVKLKVFDLLGREIANLVNENLSAGSYKFDFNASALPSGIYFYKLETDNFSETKKMVVVK